MIESKRVCRLDDSTPANTEKPGVFGRGTGELVEVDCCGLDAFSCIKVVLVL